MESHNLGPLLRDEDEPTLERVAALMQERFGGPRLTRERVRQLEGAALAKLKRFFTKKRITLSHLLCEGET